MRRAGFGVVVAVLCGTIAQGGQAPAKPIGAGALPDISGKTWGLRATGDKKVVVVVFLGTQCPVNNAYLPRLTELHDKFAPQGAQFFAINANHHDTAAAIADHAKKHKLPFPVLRDADQKVADQLGARRTPEAFVLDAKGVIRYQGRIDDQFGVSVQRPQPTRHDLAEALDEVLAGKTVSQPTTTAAGCIITRAPRPKADAGVTFSKHVARVMQNHCQECHRPAQIGPMPLLTYEDASPWAETIREVIEEKRMPPWHADPRHGKFANDRALPKEDRDTLLAWIDQGCPKGDERDLPAPRKFPEGWTIGRPDVVLSMTKEFTVPAKAPKSGIKYQYFAVPTNFAEDRWVQAAEAKPGNRAVVHHIIVYILGERKKGRAGFDGIGQGMLAAHAPGDLGTVFIPGAAKKLPKGATLYFQMHYTPNGTEQTDRSSIGLIFAKEPPKHEVRTRAIAQQLLFIPPGSGNHKVTSATTFPKDTILWSLFPHMHLRGKDFEYRAVFPDGKTQTLLSVPRFDFNWQASYRLAEPLRLPAGTRIECTAHFDNSKANLNNPDPTRWVRWGDQTWEEMMIGFADYTMVDEGTKQ